MVIMKQLPKDKDLDLMSLEDLQRHRPDLVESIGRKAKPRVENLDEAKSFAGYPGRCTTCGQPVKSSKKKSPKESVADGFKESDPIGSRRPAPGNGEWVKVAVSDSRKRMPIDAERLDAIKASLYESFVLAGLEPEAAKIAAGLEESYIGDVKVSDILKG